MEMRKRKPYLEADRRWLIPAFHCSHATLPLSSYLIHRYWTSAYLECMACNEPPTVLFGVC